MVQMASKLLYGNSIADWQERINVARMREERIARARTIMRTRGIPALLVASNDNIRYLTGLRGAAFAPQLRYLLFFADYDPVVFEHAGWLRQITDQAPWIKNWRIARSWLGGVCGEEASREEAKLFAAEIHQELVERGLAGEKLGIASVDGMGRSALDDAGLHCVDAGRLLVESRAIKTAVEIDCEKMVAAIVEAAWYKVWKVLRPGIREGDLTLAVANATFRAGADEVPSVGFRSGPATFERGFHKSDRLIQTGDLVYGSLCGIRYMGYSSCTYRTFIVGRRPNDREKDWYKRLLERMDAVIDAIKPGNTTADAAKHFAPASTWGYAEEAEVLSIEIGHGIGIGSGYEIPIINRQWSLKNPQVFEPGMVVAVESREGEHRVGGVRLENMVVVTDKGAEIIDHFPREEILVAGLHV